MAWYLHEPGDDEFKFVGKGKGNRALRSGITPRALATPPAASPRVLDGTFPSSPGGGGSEEEAAAKLARAVLKRVEELRGLQLRDTLDKVIFAFLTRCFSTGKESEFSSARIRVDARGCTCPDVDIVGYGLGTTAFGTNTLIQLAALLLIAQVVREMLPRFACHACRAVRASASPAASGDREDAAPTPIFPEGAAGSSRPPHDHKATVLGGRAFVSAFDPMTSAVDAALLRHVGVSVIAENEGCRRPARIAPACAGRCTASSAGSTPAATTAAATASAAVGPAAVDVPAEAAAAASTRTSTKSTLADSSGEEQPCLCPKRVVPLVAFMPHCDAPLYGALLTANLRLTSGEEGVAASEHAAAAAAPEIAGAGAPDSDFSPPLCSALPLLTQVCLIGNSFTWYARAQAVSAAASGSGSAGTARRRNRGKHQAKTDLSEPAGLSSGAVLRTAARLATGGSAPEISAVFAALAATCSVREATELTSAGVSSSDTVESDPFAVKAAEVPFPLSDADVLVERALDATSAHLFII